jgi:hypothetical protein
MALHGLATNDPLIEEMRSLADVGEYDEKATEGVACFLVDCARRKDLEEIATSLEKLRSHGVPILFLHPEPADFSSVFGVGVGAGTPATFVYPGRGYDIVKPLGLSSEEVAVQDETQDVTMAGAKPEGFSELPQVDPRPAQPHQPNESIVSKAVRLLENDDAKSLQGQADARPRNVPINLPAHQYRFVYYTLNSDTSISPPSGWGGGSQSVKGELMFEILLVASFNPELKYMRVTTMGAGFNPNPLKWNDEYKRGYYQDGVAFSVRPKGNNINPLTVRETSPQNVNGSTSYTAGSSFSVGVDVSSNPGLNASYTISNETTTTVSDFNIYNNSAGRDSVWKWQMGMTDGDKFRVFETHAFGAPTVRGLPTLARMNMQCVKTAVWQVSSPRQQPWNQSISLELWTMPSYHLPWVSGSWPSYTMHINYAQPQTVRTPIVDFSVVRS